jgi:hypothetical protein
MLRRGRWTLPVHRWLTVRPGLHPLRARPGLRQVRSTLRRRRRQRRCRAQVPVQARVPGPVQAPVREEEGAGRVFHRTR